MNKKSNFLVYIFLAVAVLVLSVSTTLAALMDTDKGESIMKFGKVSIYADGVGSDEVDAPKTMLHAELVNDSFAGDDIVVNEGNKLQFVATGDSADFYAKVRFTYRASTEESTEQYKEVLADLTNGGVPAGMNLFAGAGYKYYTHTDGWSYLVVDDGDETTEDKKLKVVSGGEDYVITQDYMLKYGIYATETAVIEMYRALEELGQSIELVCEVKAIQAEGAKVAEDVLSAGDDKEADYGNASIYDFIRIELENAGIVNEIARLEGQPEGIVTPKMVGNRLAVNSLAIGEGFGFKYKITNPESGILTRLAVICEEGSVAGLTVMLNGKAAMVSEYAEGDHEIEVVVKANAADAAANLIFAVETLKEGEVRKNSNATPETLAKLLANSVEGDTIILTEGEYGRIAMGTKAKPFAKNLTIVGTEGAKVAGIKVTRGVNSVTVDSLPAGLTLKNITFTADAQFISGKYERLSIIGCKFENGARIVINPTNMEGGTTDAKNVAALWTVKDLTIEGCEFSGARYDNSDSLMMIYNIAGTTTIKGNKVNGANYNAIQIAEWTAQKKYGYKHDNEGTLIIEGNEFRQTGSRFLRFVLNNMTSVKINNNVMDVANLTDDNGDNVIKITGMSTSEILEFEGNTVAGEIIGVGYDQYQPLFVDLGAGYATPTPKAVIDAIAAAEEGATIKLLPGNYELIQVNKSVSFAPYYAEEEGKGDVVVAGMRISKATKTTEEKIFAGLKLEGIKFTNSVDFYNGIFEGITVENCKFLNGANLDIVPHSMKLDGGSETARAWMATDVTIKGCEFEGAGYELKENNAGTGERSAIRLYNLKGTTTIENNTINGAAWNGIQVNRAVAGINAGELNIVNNEIKNVGSRFMRLVADAMKVTITGNTMAAANKIEAEATENNGNVLKIVPIGKDALTFAENTVDEADAIVGDVETAPVYADLGNHAATPATFAAVLAAAQPEAKIMLAAGNYGKINLTKFPQGLTIVGVEGAVVSGMEVTGPETLSSKLTLQGIKFTQPVKVLGNIEDLTVDTCKFTGGANLSINELTNAFIARNVKVQGCEFTEGVPGEVDGEGVKRSSITIYNAAGNTDIIGNTINGAAYNGIRVCSHDGITNKGALTIKKNNITKTGSTSMMLEADIMEVTILENVMSNANKIVAESDANGICVVKISSSHSAESIGEFLKVKHTENEGTEDQIDLGNTINGAFVNIYGIVDVNNTLNIMVTVK